MKLVIMTKPTFFVEEDKILTTLFDEGMDCLHLFKPNSSPVYSERLLSLLPEDFHRKITVHEHYYLKNEYGLGGIHIDNMSQPLPEDYKSRFSRTCTSISQLKEAKRKSEYVFLGNIFDDIASQTPASHSKEDIRQASRQGLIDRHVYALGGIALDNIKEAKDLGFGGVVVCDDLWNMFNIHNELDFKSLISHFERIRKATSW